MQILARSKVYYLCIVTHKTHDVHVDSKARVCALIF